ncbi:MAG TPA: methylenetetrahydrofolate reductase [Steroidobacteraceae bacterium]|jgi:methylenetetrahydrofolate reductase (NADPH)
MTSGALERRLRAGEFAITAEITPPLSADPQDLVERTVPLRGLADAVNVTDGASARAHLDTLTAAGLMVRNGIDPILQLTCRDRNRIALQSLLLGAAAQGVTNLLALRGDDPSKGDQPEAKPVFDLDASALLRTAATMRDRGQLPHGREIRGRIDFFIGGADMPIDPAAGWKPESLQRKLDAGAQFVQTQFCMDPALLRRYIARLAEFGITERLFIIVGLAPLVSARSARWIRDRLFGSIIPEPLIARLEAADDPKAEGHRICLELMHEYRDIRGVHGVHLMAPLNESAVPSVIADFRGQATLA